MYLVIFYKGMCCDSRNTCCNGRVCLYSAILNTFLSVSCTTQFRLQTCLRKSCSFLLLGIFSFAFLVFLGGVVCFGCYFCVHISFPLSLTPSHILMCLPYAMFWWWRYACLASLNCIFWDKVGNRKKEGETSSRFTKKSSNTASKLFMYVLTLMRGVGVYVSLGNHCSEYPRGSQRNRVQLLSSSWMLSQGMMSTRQWACGWF